MDNNPIKYSDLISDDGAINEAIAQLNLLNETYKGLMATVKSYAKEVSSAIKNAGGATEESRQVTKKAADDVSRLEKAQNELAFAYSETGVKVAELKGLIAEKNSASKTEAQATRSASDSYKQLEAELNILVTSFKNMTREQALNSQEGQKLLSKIVSLKNEIREYDSAMRASVSSNKSSVASMSELEKAKAKLQYAMSAESAMLLELMRQTKEANTVAKLNMIIANEQAGSYNALSAQYALNKIALNKMTEAERLTTVSGRNLVEETNNIYASMSRLQEVTGNHTLSVGNYKKTWDGLGMGVSQVVRELPAAAVSLNTFFLGISNNIPILMDEIKKLRVANVAAAAAGEKTVNITRKLIGAFFSWNTILVVVLTVFSMFGRQIIEFIGSLFGAEKAIQKVVTAHTMLHEASAKGREDAQKDVIRMKLLYDATQNVTKSMDYRLKAIKELRKLYPEQLKNISDEAILAGKASDAYINLAASIIKSAMARAAEDKIVENSKKLLELDEQRIGTQALMILKQRELNKAIAENKLANQSQTQSSSTMMPVTGDIITTSAVSALDSEMKDLADTADYTARQIDEIKKANDRLAAGIDITDLDFAKDPKAPKAKKDPKDPADRTEQIEKANLEIRKKYAESVTALELDELIKQKQAYQDTYIAESEALMNKFNNDADLTEESRGLILKIIQNMGIKLGIQNEQVNNEISKRELEMQAETLGLKLDATEEGSYDEAAVRLEILENSRKQELLANKMLIESQRQSEEEINKKWNNIISTERSKSTYELGMEQFDILQKFNESEFNLIEHAEKKKTKFKLQQEKERWMKILEFAKSGALKLTDLEIKTIENLIKRLDYEMNRTKEFDFYSLFGLSPTDEQKEAVNTIISETIDNLKSALDAEIEMADIAIAKSDDKIATKQKALDDEIEARNAGYAYNVTLAAKELEDEKKKNAKALKEKEKLVKAQQKLDTITQTSSLITAAANIWAAMTSSGGALGVILAIAGIGAMFGSFIYSKIKANELTKAKSYGEGGFEELDGGSHASGNDISIGVTRDGRQRKAEGGEGLAIVRKDKMRKYRGLVPEIINSLNKGTFEKRFSRIFNTDNASIEINQKGQSLSVLEQEVTQIRKQGEKKTIVNPKGDVITYYKNLKITVKS